MTSLLSSVCAGSAIDQNVNDQADGLAFFATITDGQFSVAPDRAIAERTAHLATELKPSTWGLMIGGVRLVGCAIRQWGRARLPRLAS